MAQAGKVATEGTRQVIDRVRETNRDFLVSLAAADNRCKLPAPRLAMGSTSSLCDPAGQGRLVTRWTARETAPSLAVIEGISAYLGAVDAIVTREPVDLSADLEEVRAKLSTLAGNLNVLVGTPNAPELTDEQASAVNGVLDLVSGLADEAGRVDDLRKLEIKTDQAKFSASIDALQALNVAFVRRLDGQLTNELATTDLELDRLTKEPASARRAAAARQLEIIELREGVPALRTALEKTTITFREAHAAYLSLLFDGGTKLTDTERRKRAALIEARVLAALHGLASLVKAF